MKREVLAEHGFEVIDAHIHPFLENEGANIAAYGSPASPDEFVAELKSLGISKVCGSVILRKDCRMEDIREANRIALRFQNRYPDFYLPGIHVHGGFPEESCEEIETMVQKGVRWIGELVPYIMNTGEYNSPGMMRIFDLAQQLGIPVNLHDGWPAELIDPAVKQFPNLKLVLAHPGETGRAKERFEYMALHDNVYMDLSGTGLFRWNMLKYGVDLCGADRFLFGSDFPICSPGMNLFGVLSENLSDAECRLIFSENFKRLTEESSRL